LKGNEIHYLARLLTVVDAFDAMTSLRPYQKTKSYTQAMEELSRCSGTQFDPAAVKAFIRCLEERNGTDQERCDKAFMHLQNGDMLDS